MGARRTAGRRRNLRVDAAADGRRELGVVILVRIKNARAAGLVGHRRRGPLRGAKRRVAVRVALWVGLEVGDVLASASSDAHAPMPPQQRGLAGCSRWRCPLDHRVHALVLLFLRRLLFPRAAQRPSGRTAAEVQAAPAKCHNDAHGRTAVEHRQNRLWPRELKLTSLTMTSCRRAASSGQQGKAAFRHEAVCAVTECLRRAVTLEERARDHAAGWQEGWGGQIAS